MRSFVVVLLLCCFGVLPALSQPDPNTPTISPIQFDAPVTDIITEAAIFDWWLLNLSAGESIRVTMAGEEGLAPLLGLLDANSNLVQRTEDGNPDGTVTFTYTVEQSGEFRIIATRAGNADGTTVGRYTLTVESVRLTAPEPDPYEEVTLDCGGESVPNALTLRIEEDEAQMSPISASVYGLEGFQPVLRSTLEFSFDPFFDQFCIVPIGEGPGVGLGDRLQLPGEDLIEWERGVAKTVYEDLTGFSRVQLNVGAQAGSSGRYVVVIHGLTAGEGGDRDLLEIGLGPLAQEEPLLVYAVSDKSTRLDASIQQIDDGTDVLWQCDDAGVLDCEDVPPIAGFEWYGAEDDLTATANRFDAGILLQPNAPDKQRLLLGAFDGRTSGNYSIVIVGQFPGR